MIVLNPVQVGICQTSSRRERLWSRHIQHQLVDPTCISNLYIYMHREHAVNTQSAMCRGHAASDALIHYKALRVRATGRELASTATFQCCLTSTETIRTVRDGDPRTATSAFTQLLSSELQPRAGTQKPSRKSKVSLCVYGKLRS